MRIEAIDPAATKLVYAGLAGASGTGTWISAASDVVVQLLGVPLPVVLGAATGAFLARAYLPSSDPVTGEHIGFFRALAVSIGWTLAGSIAAPVVHAAVPTVATLVPGMGPLTLPAGALAGIAGLVAAAPAWWPRVWPWIAARLPGGKGGGT